MTDAELIAKLKDRITKLENVLGPLCDENDVLRDKVKKYEALLQAISDERGLLGVLQKMAHNPALPNKVRIKAAAAGLAYERPKLSATITTNVVSLAARLDQPKIIEHDPKPAA